MELIVQTLICLVSVLGIIFITIISVDPCEESSKTRKCEKNNKVELIIKVKGLDDEKQNEILDKIKFGMYKDIYDIVDLVKIVKI